MAKPIFIRNSAVLAKLETVEGQDALPVPTLDAVLVENPQVDTDTKMEETNEVSASLDKSAPIPGGTSVKVTFDVLLKGSGVAGVPPEFGKLLKACGWAEVIMATPLPAAAEAVSAGSATTVTLGDSAAATAQLYRGMPVQIGGTPPEAAGIYPIADYTAGRLATLAAAPGAAIAGTSTWQILPCVVYRPASVNIPSVTLYVYKDGKLKKVTGCRGTVTVKLTSGGVGRISVEFSGMWGGETDEPVPSDLVHDTTRPPVWRGGRALIQRSPAAMASLSVQTGNTLTNPDNPNSPEAFDPAVITARNVTGSCDPLEELVATRNTMALLRSGTPQILLADYGTTAGNRPLVMLPAAQVTQRKEGDREGMAVDQLTFAGTGRDAGAFLAFY